MCFVHYCCFCWKEFDLIFYKGIVCMIFLFLYISICLKFLSNSLRSFLSSRKLLLRVGQNSRLSLSRFIWSLFNLCEDKFMIFCFMWLSFFILFFSSCCFLLKNGFCLYFLRSSNFCFHFLNRGFCIVVFRVVFIIYEWVRFVLFGVECIVVGPSLLRVCVIIRPILLRVLVVCVVV